MKHTPGPWYWTNGEHHCGHPCTPNGGPGHDDGLPSELEPVGLWFDILEYSPNDDDIKRWFADARLIAAAPELLNTLEELADLMEDTINGTYIPNSFTLQPSRAAIAKATGKEES